MLNRLSYQPNEKMPLPSSPRKKPNSPEEIYPKSTRPADAMSIASAFFKSSKKKNELANTSTHLQETGHEVYGLWRTVGPSSALKHRPPDDNARPRGLLRDSILREHPRHNLPHQGSQGPHVSRFGASTLAVAATPDLRRHVPWY